MVNLINKINVRTNYIEQDKAPITSCRSTVAGGRTPTADRCYLPPVVRAVAAVALRAAPSSPRSRAHRCPSGQEPPQTSARHRRPAATCAIGNSRRAEVRHNVTEPQRRSALLCAQGRPEDDDVLLGLHDPVGDRVEELARRFLDWTSDAESKPGGGLIWPGQWRKLRRSLRSGAT